MAQNLNLIKYTHQLEKDLWNTRILISSSARINNLLAPFASLNFELKVAYPQISLTIKEE